MKKQITQQDQAQIVINHFLAHEMGIKMAAVGLMSKATKSELNMDDPIESLAGQNALFVFAEKRWALWRKNPEIIEAVDRHVQALLTPEPIALNDTKLYRRLLSINLVKYFVALERIKNKADRIYLWERHLKLTKHGLIALRCYIEDPDIEVAYSNQDVIAINHHKKRIFYYCEKGKFEGNILGYEVVHQTLS
ncbi:hypothetical protein HC723_13255 [Vibrio sp. S11_S32]|uniref:hypothetical protein n=1 Tax=Vibrio sp. S11_S32 TaxID=2720225 RepID=UPI001681BD6F|nr:hypothetical protein [Vibrio sp. S11_S32]MBD1577396.1 hypothetical protein [Vibrio sp. S11_S32]